MHSTIKATVASLALGVATTSAFADGHALSGDLRILVAGFGEQHPDLNIELEIVDREAWKTQIRNALTANAPDVVNWYAATRMIRRCWPVHGHL